MSVRTLPILDRKPVAEADVLCRGSEPCFNGERQVRYTNALKGQQITQYGYPITAPAAYEEDHLISLQLGGAPVRPTQSVALAV